MQNNHQALIKNYKFLILLRKFKISSLFLSLLSITSFTSLTALLTVTNSANAALTAVTANTIHGTAPKLTASAANKLGFILYNKPYSAELGNLTGGVNYFGGELKLSDFQIKNLAVSELSVGTGFNADYADDDGDRPRSTSPFTVGGGTTLTWKDRNGSTITDKSKTLGCGSSFYQLPLTLTITTANVRAYSQYGDPNASMPVTLTKTYQISSNDGICFVKPKSPFWAAGVGGTSNPHASLGGGYKSDFDPSKGFKTGGATKFPTTAFVGAEFQLIMSSASNSYTYSSNSSAVKVDGNGKVTFTGKPSGAVTITATKSGASYPYMFTIKNKGWFEPKGATYYNYEQAKTQCGGEGNLPTRADLSNSPQKTAAQNSSFLTQNHYTRAIGEGVGAEWGELSYGVYSSWSTASCHWTRDPHSTGRFTVRPDIGNVAFYATTSSCKVVCNK